jgi:TolB-like protein
MRKIISMFLSLLFVLNVAAQKSEKYDIILKTNGDELTGLVKEINDDDVKFVHKGETLVYTIKKSDIFRISFASGRIEVITKPSQATETKAEQKTETETVKSVTSSSNTVDHRNKVAVLPFTFIRDNQSMGDDMAYKVQDEVYSYLKKNSSTYTIIDPRTTNALLLKAGVTRDKMMGFTMDELCNILGVEYVVEGTIKQNKGVETSVTSEDYKTKDDKKSSDKKVSGTTTTTTTQPYKTNVTLNVYNDKGANIYSQNRTGIFASSDGSYDNTLDYLLKRSPFYSKK